MHRIRAITIALACALILLSAGIWLGGHPDRLPSGLRDAFVDDDRALRIEVREAIQNDFYKKVDQTKLEDASLKGLVRALDDRFSHYFTKRETKLFEQSVSGQFDGVGMSVEQAKRGLLVINVFAGSPASRAGIRKGDVITDVNGRSIAGESTDVATARIKGEAGTSVQLTVLTPDTRRTRTTRVKRARIEVPVTRSRLDKRDGRPVGVVELLSFTSGAHGRLRREIDGQLRKGAEGILLDLRGNGGGLLEESVLVSSIFVESGTVVSTRGRNSPERDFEAQGKAIPRDVPVVVLVDRGSASASEIVAGALRDRRRATLVGTRTFGKGVFQEVKQLSNGGSLDLTVGSYYLPNGENISDRGITPAIKASDQPRTKRDEALPTALEALRAEIR